MRARVSTLWYFLQGMRENRCLKIRECARMVFFAEDDGGGITGPPDDVQIIGWNACMSVLICKLHIAKGSR